MPPTSVGIFTSNPRVSSGHLFIVPSQDFTPFNCRHWLLTPFGSLAFKVEVASNSDEKIDRILPLLESRTGSAIIYVSLQKQAHRVAEILLENGLE